MATNLIHAQSSDRFSLHVLGHDHVVDARVLAILLEGGQEGVVVIDRRGNMRQVNPALCHLVGYVRTELEGRNVRRFLDTQAEHLFMEEVLIRVWYDGFWQGETELRRRDGVPLQVRMRVRTVIVPRRDQRPAEPFFLVQVSRAHEDGDVDHPGAHSSIDPLTGLPNRMLFEDRLNQAITQARRHGKSIGTMFLDIDRFKVINESLGYVSGDTLLKTVAGRLARCLRTSDSLARIGADEFGLLLADIDEGAGPVRNISVVARKVYEALEERVVLNGQELEISAAMGITLYPQDGTSAKQIMENADTALSHARRKGRHNYQFFSSEMTETARKRFELESSLRHAAERGELRLFYQPQVDLRSGEIIGAEALVRWMHPERGLVSPGEFIPVAEESGIIVAIGTWVLRTACWQMAEWKAAGIQPIRIGVNLSAMQFKRQDLASLVEEMLVEWQIDPELLDLEITESAIMEDVERAVSMLNRISALGVKLSIDDFGTGYSSLSQLRQFPFKTLKIDRSFVNNISTQGSDAAIVSAIVAMAHSLNQTVIVEGLETNEQLAIMRRLKCNEMQGFLFSAPVPADQFTEMLRQGKRLDLGIPQKV